MTPEEFRQLLEEKDGAELLEPCLRDEETPYVFGTKPETWNAFRDDLSDSLGITRSEIRVVGSARFGFSMKPGHNLRAFKDTSDIDVVFVNADLFDQLWISLLEAAYPRPPQTLASSPELVIDLPAAPPEQPEVAPPDVATPPRCSHRYPNGSRCRLSPTQSGLCSRHFLEARLNKATTAPLSHTIDDSIDLSPDLLPELSESSAFDIHQFLARLLVQLTKGRVSPRRAWVLSCISNQLLHAHHRGSKRT